jgi:hypothetical protein
MYFRCYVSDKDFRRLRKTGKTYEIIGAITMFLGAAATGLSIGLAGLALKDWLWDEYSDRCSKKRGATFKFRYRGYYNPNYRKMWSTFSYRGAYCNKPATWHN